MSDIRTLTDLQQEMSADFAWRKKELHTLKSMVSSNQQAHSRDLWIRAGITLLYAHWEGFIRKIGSCYLEFVARKQLTHDELRSNFVGVIINRLVRDATAGDKISRCLDIVEFFRTEGGKPSKIAWKAGINTKANLKSDVFQEIVLMLGLDYTRFSTKEKLLDERLLKNRNSIAHGQYLIVRFEEYMDLHDEMLAIMQDFYNQIENSAFSGSYKNP